MIAGPSTLRLWSLCSLMGSAMARADRRTCIPDRTAIASDADENATFLFPALSNVRSSATTGRSVNLPCGIIQTSSSPTTFRCLTYYLACFVAKQLVAIREWGFPSGIELSVNHDAAYSPVQRSFAPYCVRVSIIRLPWTVGLSMRELAGPVQHPTLDHEVAGIVFLDDIRGMTGRKLPNHVEMREERRIQGGSPAETSSYDRS